MLHRTKFMRSTLHPNEGELAILLTITACDPLTRKYTSLKCSVHVPGNLVNLYVFCRMSAEIST